MADVLYVFLSTRVLLSLLAILAFVFVRCPLTGSDMACLLPTYDPTVLWCAISALTCLRRSDSITRFAKRLYPDDVEACDDDEEDEAPLLLLLLELAMKLAGEDRRAESWLI